MPYKEGFLSRGIWTLINLFLLSTKKNEKWNEIIKMDSLVWT